MEKQRLQKILAHAGLCSRREAETLIREGQVSVNGKIAKLGDQADPLHDAIKFKGKLLQLGKNQPEKVYFAFHKPEGVISMLNEDPEGRPTLKKYLGKLKPRVFPVGRLSFNTSGLLLLTNDGDIPEKILTHPEIIRSYSVKVRGHLTDEQIQSIARGGRIENKKVKPLLVESVERLKNKTKILLVFKGQTSLDVKELLDIKRIWVEKISRVQIGQLTLKGVLLPGLIKKLKQSQIDALLEQPELGQKTLQTYLRKKKK